MVPEYISNILFPIGFGLFIVISYYSGKKIENISKNLNKKETKKLRTELMRRKDISWLATFKLPKIFEYIGNILALLFILFFITIFIASLVYK